MRHRERQRQTASQPETETVRQRQRDKDTETETKRERERKRLGEQGSGKDRGGGVKETERCIDTLTQTKRKIQTPKNLTKHLRGEARYGKHRKCPQARSHCCCAHAYILQKSWSQTLARILTVSFLS